MRPQPFLFALACSAVLAGGSQQPDFSGTWVATTEAPRDIAAAPSPVFGARFAIAQKANEVVLTRISRDGSFAATLPAGTDVHLRVPGRACEGDSARIEKIAFEGDALAYTLVGTVAPGATEPRIINVKYLMRREADTLTVQGTMVQQGQPRPVATVYRRSSESMPAPVVPAPLPVKGIPARIAQAEWIGTTWIGATANGGSVEERWTPAASGAMLGIGRTVRGATMTGFEFLCIAEREDTLVYFAMPNARMPATPFVLTAATAGSLTFENPSHDFPKLIRYSRLEDGSLETTIAAPARRVWPRTATAPAGR
jgi:hypothetical protein